MLLQQPGLIGNLRLKNRVLMAPMGTNYSTTDGFSTQRDSEYYAERARGGVAMIMTEAMIVTETARSHHNSLCCFHDRFIPGLARLVAGVKEHDCLVFGQLNHRGGLLRRAVLNMEPVGPSDWINPNTGDAVRALRVGEIHDIQKLFVAAARRLSLAGYDGVEIHAGNGYLFQQFFTRRINQRKDQYGGSIQNRMRMLLETIDRVHQELPDLCLVVRLSASEFVEDGYSLEEIIELAQAVERSGVAAIDLSGGSNESPQLSKYCIQPPSFARGCLAPTAKPIKDAVNVPVFVAGRIVQTADAEEVLASGSADFVSIGRALYADPHWALKAFGEVKAPIRQCIACNVCFERLTLEKDVSCVQNPMVGTEFEALKYSEPHLFAPPAGPRKRVLVLGAGVAGIEAARIARGRGHTVEVWEKSDRVGGQIHLAVAAPDKTEVQPVWDYRWQEIVQMKVPVHTGVDADAPMMQKFNPDFVLVATGAVPRDMPINTSDVAPDIQIMHAWEAFLAPEKIAAGSRVTVIGGGMVGVEIADLLRLQACDIQVLEMQATAANGMARNNKFELLERIADSGVRVITQCKIEHLSGRHIGVQTGVDAPTQLDIGDVLIFATGPRSEMSVLAAVKSLGVPFAQVGDCSAPGDFLTAIRDGWMVGLSIDEQPFTGKNNEH
jgi:2,4-dienoyl-CoA reductase-like NADH-dependent reductase (Old Yellow Enzyme family)/thioredoxin reductase